MSEPTATAAIPKPEDKPTEVTSAVEPSPETKVETPAPAPVRRLTLSSVSFILTHVLIQDAPKEDVKADEPTTTEVCCISLMSSPFRVIHVLFCRSDSRGHR